MYRNGGKRWLTLDDVDRVGLPSRPRELGTLWTDAHGIAGTRSSRSALTNAGLSGQHAVAESFEAASIQDDG